MKRGLMDILVCPVCRGPLRLSVVEEDGDEIVSGTLGCDSCGEIYPVADMIPNFLPPELRD